MVALSRRGLISAGAATAACAAFPPQLLAASFRPGAAGAAPAGEAPLFGPAAGVALLSRNENPYGPAPSALSAINDWAGKGCYYAEGGSRRLASMIAERFSVSPDQVILGSGSTEVLSAAALALKSKGAILAPELFWDSTTLYAERKGSVLKRVALNADLDIDLDAMAAAVTPDVGLVHICNPNNPTGRVLDGDKLRAFIRAVSPKATVLVDEAYMELTDKPEYSSMMDMVKEGHDLIVCRTFSKIYGMAGLRVGYAVAKPETVAKVRAFEMSMGGNTAGLAAAIASYNDTSFTTFSKNKIVEARGMILAAVKSCGLEALPSQTNFVYVKVPDANKVKDAMAAKGVQIRGAYGKWTQWSRVSTGKIEDVKRYCDALPAAVKA